MIARPPLRQSFLRVMDANINRAREGLRVCEEVSRLVLEESALTHRCQRLRYTLKGIVQKISLSGFPKARDAQFDVGRPSLRGRVSPHRGYPDLVKANAQRIEEALRVLEEFSRLKSPQTSRAFALLRFRVYTLEKELLSKLSSLLHR